MNVLVDSWITSISEKPSHESYVYRNPCGGTVQKLYWEINGYQLEKYAQIQNALGEFTIDNIDPLDLPFCDGEINRVVIKILEIPGKSYEASSIVEGNHFKKPCRVTLPKYIGGVSLYELYYKYSEDKTVEGFLESISYYVNEFFEGRGVAGVNLFLDNAKMTKASDGALEIVITDIAGSIPHMLDLTVYSPEEVAGWGRIMRLVGIDSGIPEMHRF